MKTITAWTLAFTVVCVLCQMVAAKLAGIFAGFLPEAAFGAKSFALNYNWLYWVLPAPSLIWLGWVWINHELKALEKKHFLGTLMLAGMLLAVMAYESIINPFFQMAEAGGIH